VATSLPLDLDLRAARERLLELRPDVVFNLVESVGGQGRLIHLAPALLEALGLPYTGCSAEATFLTSGKPLAKRLLAQAGIPTAPAFARHELAAGSVVPPGRWIVKSAWEHASVGLDEDSVLEGGDAGRLLEALERRLPALGGEGFVEAFLPGREFNLGLLEAEQPGAPPVHLPPAEIEFKDWPAGKERVVGFRAKWDEGSFEYVNTVRRYEFAPGDAAFLAEAGRLARACWDLFRLGGYARVDLRGDAEGRPVVLEVNTNPCLTPGAGYAAALEVAGLRYEDVIERIALAALRRAGLAPREEGA
jgi:D-alanine-D-alanine ligase